MFTAFKIAAKGISSAVLNLVLPRSCAGCGAANEIFCDTCKNTSYKKGAQCLFCGFRNKDGKVCYECVKKSINLPPTPSFVRRGSPAINKILWAGRYDGALKEAIWQLKYGRRKELAKPLAKMLFKKFLEIYEFPSRQSGFQDTNIPLLRNFSARAVALRKVLKTGLPSPDISVSQSPSTSVAIIPIPLHFKKEYERGFNQAELLAREFSKLSNFQLLSNTLLKVRETPAQVEVENKELRIENLENAFEVNPLALHLRKGEINKKPSPLQGEGWEGYTIILIDDVSTTGATLLHASRALTQAGVRDILGLVVAHG